jgi:hypothetical protein
VYLSFYCRVYLNSGHVRKMFAFSASILSVILSTLVFLVFEAQGFGIRPGTYMPMNETDRGKNLKSIKSFSERVAEMHKQGGHLTLIFGFSTGHVGTTTLCTPAAYNADEIAQNNVKFVFERAGVPPAVCGKRDWDMKKEIQHVEYYYGPEILTDVPLTGKSTIVDLSHANICFYRGLIHVLHRENIPFKFIRIRRERLETAVSLSILVNDTVDFFGRDYYRFHPFEAQHLTHLRIPGGNATWKKFTATQKIFWVIDETQARWEALLAHFPDLPVAYIYWSKEKDNLAGGVSVVAKSIGVHAAKKAPPTTKVHAGDKSESDSLRARLAKQDQEYRQIMGFNLTLPELLNFQNQHLTSAIATKKYLYNSTANGDKHHHHRREKPDAEE